MLQKTARELAAGKSSWPLLKDMMANAVNPYELVPAEVSVRERILSRLGFSTNNLLGALVHETGGILVDSGLVRVLAAGGDKLKRNIVDWNIGRSYCEGESPGYMLVADDITGGLFALNGGELGEDIGKTYYLPPDSLSWESMDITLQGFFEFCFFADLEEFYAFSLKKDWRLLRVSGDDVLIYTPPLWEDAQKNIEERAFRIVSSGEAYEIFLNANNSLEKSGE